MFCLFHQDQENGFWHLFLRFCNLILSLADFLFNIYTSCCSLLLTFRVIFVYIQLNIKACQTEPIALVCNYFSVCCVVETDNTVLIKIKIKREVLCSKIDDKRAFMTSLTILSGIESFSNHQLRIFEIIQF